MHRIIAIGDIHGCCTTFKKLILEKIKVTKTDRIYCIGDYIDRGNDSKGVIDFIMELKTKGFTVFTLRGNHEQMMLDALHHKKAMKLWIDNGGSKTLQSFGIHSLADMEEKYWSFFHETILFFKTENYIFVHAGLNFQRTNIFEDKEAMLWIRDFSSVQPALENKLLIYGHTPISLNEILQQKGNCIDIDGGCVYKDHYGMGHLVAIDLTSNKFIWQKNCD